MSIRKSDKLSTLISSLASQQILCQTIVKSKLSSESEIDSDKDLSMDSLLIQFENSQIFLVKHNSSLQFPDSIRGYVDSLFTSIAPYFNVILTKYIEQVDSSEESKSSVSQEEITNAGSNYLLMIGNILGAYESQKRVLMDVIYHRISFASYQVVISSVLIGFIAMIFALRMIRKYTNFMEESRQQLAEAHKTIMTKLERMDFLTRSIKVGVWERSFAENTESWSSRLYQIFGFEENEIKGTYDEFLNRVHPKDRNILLEAGEKSLKSGGASSIEIRILTKDNEYKWVEAIGNVKRDVNGKVSLMIGAVTLINERKKLENQLFAFVHNAPAAIAMFNKQMEYIAVSERWRKDYLRTDESVIGFSHYKISPEISDEWKAIHQKCLSGEIHARDEDLYIYKDGTKHWLKWAIHPWYMSEDEVGGLLIFREDISERKKKNEELKKSKEAADKASKAKEEFLASMSHEIRTPLNAINGLAHILLSEDPKPDQIENLNLLKFSGDNLLSLINDILDISKIDSGKLKLDSSPFDLYYLVDNIRRSLEYRAKENLVVIKTEYDKELPRIFIGDVTRITQIIYNLAGNAIKFTTGGNVSIAIKYLSGNDKKYLFRISVKDDGIGISSENQQKIFNSFQQAEEGTTRKFGGTGLGLYICRKLVQMMGSQIQLESELGKGSHFYFDIELKRGSMELKQNIKSTLENTDFSDRNITILVAEDNLANQIIIRKMLAKAGIHFDIVENGSLAVIQAQKKSYDLIFMDLQMPEMDGFTATAKIRAIDDKYLQEIPIIALTADAFLDVKEKALKTGMNDYLSKPFKPYELFHIIDKYSRKMRNE